MNIEQKIIGTHGRFFYQEDGKELGTLKYKLDSIAGTINLTSTHVDSSMGGKGLGKQLVTAAVEFAMKENYKIIPTCPFVAALFNKIPEWDELRCK